MVRTLDACGYLERPESWGCGPAAHVHAQPRPLPRRADRSARSRAGPGLAVHIESMRPGAWGWTTAGVADEDLSQALGVAAGPVEFLSWTRQPPSDR